MAREALMQPAVELAEHVQRGIARARALIIEAGPPAVIGRSRPLLQLRSSRRIAALPMRDSRAGPRRALPWSDPGLSSADHGEWRSLVAHPAGGRAAAGSNPVSPIMRKPRS